MDSLYSSNSFLTIKLGKMGKQDRMKDIEVVSVKRISDPDLK
jgi:hypothetical protein